jgi:hypothetical protein
LSIIKAVLYGLFPKHISRRNTVSLSAGYPLGVRVFTPTRKRVPGLEFHSIRELVLRTQTARTVSLRTDVSNIVLLPVGRQVGTYPSAGNPRELCGWPPKMLEVAIRVRFHCEQG